MSCYGLPGKTALSTSNSSFGKQLAGITVGGAAAAAGWISCPVCTAVPLLSIAAVPEPWEPPVPLGCLHFAPQSPFRVSSQEPVSCVSALICAVSLFPSSPRPPRCLPGSPDPLLPPGFLRVVWLSAQGCLRLLLKLLLASPVAWSFLELCWPFLSPLLAVFSLLKWLRIPLRSSPVFLHFFVSHFIFCSSSVPCGFVACPCFHLPSSSSEDFNVHTWHPAHPPCPQFMTLLWAHDWNPLISHCAFCARKPHFSIFPQLPVPEFRVETAPITAFWADHSSFSLLFAELLFLWKLVSCYVFS